MADLVISKDVIKFEGFEELQDSEKHIFEISFLRNGFAIYPFMRNVSPNSCYVVIENNETSDNLLYEIYCNRGIEGTIHMLKSGRGYIPDVPESISEETYEKEQRIILEHAKSKIFASTITE